jgi:dipeptidyl aminopeptidase/acylaminoacyl peptidase
MAGYRDFVPARRFQPSLALSPSGDIVAYSSNVSGQFNLHTHPGVQWISFEDRSVREMAWLPDGSGLVFTADEHGDEQYQVYRLRFADGSVEQLTSGGQRFEGPSGVVLVPTGVSPDGRWLLAGGLGSNVDCRCYVAPFDGPSLREVTSSLDGSYFYPEPWAACSGGFYARATAEDGDHVGLAWIAVDGSSMRFVDASPWDVEGASGSPDGRTTVGVVNENGRSVIRAQRDGVSLPVPAFPEGVVRALSVPAGGQRIAVLLDSAVRPPEIMIADLGASGPARYLTGTRPSGLRSLVAPVAVSYPAADGASVPGLLYRPSVSGRVPVLMYLHGGSELQARPEYGALFQYLLDSGIAVFAPSVRGSSGYGHRWQQRIYRDWGGIDLSDFEAAAAYLRSLSWVDPSRIAVYGSSYGGFAALSCLSRLPDLWAAGASLCGPSNLETLVRSVPPAWRALMADMIGDPEKDADMLRAHSPLTYAGQITAPLFIIQGAKDPRVPKAESDQIVEKLRANGLRCGTTCTRTRGTGSRTGTTR